MPDILFDPSVHCHKCGTELQHTDSHVSYCRACTEKVGYMTFCKTTFDNDSLRKAVGEELANALIKYLQALPERPDD